jgi:hexokinase
VRRFLRLKEWRDCERIAVGGGFQASRVGATAVGRAALLLKDDGVPLTIDVIHNDPDHAGLIGTAYLLPPWMLKGHEAMLALDIGGTNIRAGVVEFKLKKSTELAGAEVPNLEHWRHADEDPKREDVVKRIVDMLETLTAWAEKNEKKLAPVVGIGCPGVIQDDGTIARGAQNLPGNWESSKFNLPKSIRENIAAIGKHETIVIMHNDAVVQGLSEIPYYRDCQRWGVLTIGTGLGNAVYCNRNPEMPKRTKQKNEKA